MVTEFWRCSRTSFGDDWEPQIKSWRLHILSVITQISVFEQRPPSVHCSNETVLMKVAIDTNVATLILFRKASTPLSRFYMSHKMWKQISLISTVGNGLDSASSCHRFKQGDSYGNCIIFRILYMCIFGRRWKVRLKGNFTQGTSIKFPVACAERMAAAGAILSIRNREKQICFTHFVEHIESDKWCWGLNSEENQSGHGNLCHCRPENVGIWDSVSISELPLQSMRVVVGVSGITERAQD